MELVLLFGYFRLFIFILKCLLLWLTLATISEQIEKKGLQFDAAIVILYKFTSNFIIQ